MEKEIVLCYTFKRLFLQRIRAYGDLNMSSKFFKVRSILFIVCITILAAMLVYMVSFTAEKDKNDDEIQFPFSLVYKQDGIQNRINGFYTEDTLYYCIPGFLSLENISLDMDISGHLQIGNAAFEDGSTLDSIELNQEYDAILRRNDKDLYNGTVMFMQGSDLPVIRLTTASGSMDYILAGKENYESGFMEVADEKGRVQTVAEIKSLSGRGNTAWDAPKKSFTLKLDDAQDILGMGAGKTWVLNANYYDGAYIRNQIGFEIANESEMLFTPEERFVDLYINDEYMGLYQIMEKLKTGSTRVDIGNQYFLEIDYIERAITEDDYIQLSNEQPIVIHAPEKNRDIDGVQRYFDEFTTAIESGNMTEAMEKIDMESFAKMFVMEEILQDMDFGYTSHYMYLDLDKATLYDGPVWDLDNTLGRGIVMDAVNLFVTDYDLQYNNLGRWYASLYTQPEFRRQVVREYQEHFRPEIDILLNGGIAEKTATIGASISMDRKRFPGQRSVFMPESSPEEQTEYLINYLQNKLRIMDEWSASVELDTVTEIELPELMVQEPPADMITEPENAENSNGGIVYLVMSYRLWFVLLVMFCSYMLLWYQCKRTGK